MIRKIILILALFIAGKSFGQMYKHLSPVNPELIEYYNDKKKIKVKAAAVNEKTTGYIPPYAQLPEYYESVDSSSKMKSLSLPNLPEKYDLRAIYDSVLDKNVSYVTAVKNQGSGNFGGNCWSFACLSSIESCWKTTLTSIGTTDLSEQNMATCHGYSWGFGQGGNEYFPMAYLSSLRGPVSEDDVLYNTVDTTKQKCESGHTKIAYFPETRWIYNNTVLTKKMIMEFGAVASNIYWKDSYFNKTYNSYYSNDRNGANHAISIVGWDDTKVTHKGKGAWIAKNSWGTSWGEKGFFYIAYGDKQIIKPASLYPLLMYTNSIDTLFKKESIGVVSYFGYQSDVAYALVKFNAPQEKSIQRIGSFLTKTGASMEIEVYSDSLQTLVNSYVGQPVPCPGFYTYEIPAKVQGVFFVKVKYYTPGVNRPIPVEIKADILGEIYANPIIQPSGTQWVSEDANQWQALGSDIVGWESNLVVHVYAGAASTLPIASFETDKTEVCLGGEVTFTNKSAGNISSYQWNFGDDAEPKYAVGAGPHKVKYPISTVLGVKYPALKVTGPNGTNYYSKSIKVVTDLTTLIGAPDYIKMKNSAKLTAIVDADTYLWFPSEELSDSTSKIVYFTSTTTGLHKFTVIAKQGNCSGSYTINVNLKQPPVNDETCNAIALQTGQNGPFTNRGATAEFNEPYPADTSCYDYLTWCKEGGLQNSVWFKVVPQDTILSLDTKGMDTQIALYGSESCTNIKKEDLVAANDDYYTEDLYWAAAIDEQKVEAGKTYWVQIDGSAGGDEGEFYINVSSSAIELTNSAPVSIKTIRLDNLISIYPNPGNGNFKLQYISASVETYTVTVFDMAGKTIHLTTKSKNEGLSEIPLNISGLQKGIYFVNVKGNEASKTLKCVVQ